MSEVIKQSKAVHAATSRLDCPDTPPDSPTAQLSNPLEFARQIIDTVKLIQTSDSNEASLVAVTQAEPNAQASEPIARASRAEVKEVHEMYVPTALVWLLCLTMPTWDSKAYEYKVVESPPTSKLTNLDAYVFVVRTRVGGSISPDISDGD